MVAAAVAPVNGSLNSKTQKFVSMKTVTTIQQPVFLTRSLADAVRRFAMVALFLPLCASAQWVTQTIALNTGWNVVYLPWTGTNLGTVVTLNHGDQESNRFLHTYHADHYNLDTLFNNHLVQGYESYAVTREIRLGVQAPDGEIAASTTSGKSLSGTYAETITVHFQAAL